MNPTRTLALMSVQRLVINSTLNLLNRNHHRLVTSSSPQNPILLTSDFVRGLKEWDKSIHTSALLLKKNYYAVLGVSSSATTKEIKEAYYMLAKKYHPDISKADLDCRQKFLEVSEAYDVLSDETKRKEFDMWGETTHERGRSGSSPNSDSNFAKKNWNYETNVDPEEMFRRIFGDAYKENPFEETIEFAKSFYGYGAAQEIIMGLSFEEAALGGHKEVVINVVDRCPKCFGTRCELGTKPVTCETCDGTGMEIINTGPFIMRSTCRECNGAKEVLHHPCTECSGEGQMVLRKKVPVPIPPGVENGETVRVIVGLEEMPVTFRVAESDYFRKDNFDIHTDAIISISQAILGGETTIKGLYESIIIDISPGTSSHSLLQLKGRGIKLPDGSGYGDHFLHFRVHVPTGLSKTEKEVLSAFAHLEDNVSGTVSGVTAEKLSVSEKEKKFKEFHDKAIAIHEEAMEKATAHTCWNRIATTDNIHIEWDSTNTNNSSPPTKPPLPHKDK